MFVGVDVGGSKIEAALIENGKVLKKSRRKTEADRGRDAVLQNIVQVIEAVFSNDVKAIGVGLAGPFDPLKGAMRESPHVPCLIGFTLKQYLEEKFKVKVAVDNDARMFTRGVHEFKYKEVKNLVGLTLGTGVGGAVIIDGEMEDNPRGTAEEVGHIIVEKGGRRCDCGGRGCIEAYASGGAIESGYKEITGKSLDAKKIVEKASRQDEEAKQVVKEVAVYLAKGLAMILDKYNPEVIALGGGVSDAEMLIRIARDEFGKMRPNAQVRIEKSKLKDAALLGSAWFAARS